MKKIISVIMIAVLIMLLSGCAETSASKGDIAKESAFVIIERGNTWDVVYHKETKVMYAVSNSMYNRGNFFPLLNPDGTPMLYEE